MVEKLDGEILREIFQRGRKQWMRTQLDKGFPKLFEPGMELKDIDELSLVITDVHRKTLLVRFQMDIGFRQHVFAKVLSGAVLRKYRGSLMRSALLDIASNAEITMSEQAIAASQGKKGEKGPVGKRKSYSRRQIDNIRGNYEHFFIDLGKTGRDKRMNITQTVFGPEQNQSPSGFGQMLDLMEAQIGLLDDKGLESWFAHRNQIMMIMPEMADLFSEFLVDVDQAIDELRAQDKTEDSLLSDLRRILKEDTMAYFGLFDAISVVQLSHWLRDSPDSSVEDLSDGKFPPRLHYDWVEKGYKSLLKFGKGQSKEQALLLVVEAANSLMALDDYENALHTWKFIYESGIDDLQPLSRYHLGMCEFLLGDHKEGAGYLRRVSTECSPSGLACSAQITLGEIEARAGNLTKAHDTWAECYEQIEANAPDSTKYNWLMQLALAARRSQQLSVEHRYLGKALRFAPEEDHPRLFQRWMGLGF